MKTLTRILTVVLNLSVPWLLPILLVFVCFFIYGSGAVGAEKLEKQMFIWHGIYLLIGVIHLFLVYKFIDLLTRTQKIIMVTALAALYGFFLINFMMS